MLISDGRARAEEAFTSENWIVRIYAVKKEDNFGRDHRSANAFLQGKRKKRSRTPASGTAAKGKRKAA